MEKEIKYFPIYPLSQTVFFPKTKIPLHISEEKYKMMVSDCLVSKGFLGIAHIKDGQEAVVSGLPPVFKILTVGKIIDSEELPDRKYNILIEGIERGKIISEIKNDPYPMAKITPLNDFIEVGRKAEVVEVTKEMFRLTGNFSNILPQYSKIIKKIISSYLHPGIIADMLAFTFVTDNYDKQCILSELNILRRVQLISIQLRIMIKKFSHERYKDFI